MKLPSRVPNVVLVLSALFSIIYLLNPSAGFLEFIPDNLPFIGNLDEAGATALLLWALNEWRQKRYPQAVPPRDVSPS